MYADKKEIDFFIAWPNKKKILLLEWIMRAGFRTMLHKYTHTHTFSQACTLGPMPHAAIILDPKSGLASIWRRALAKPSKQIHWTLSI